MVHPLSRRALLFTMVAAVAGRGRWVRRDHADPDSRRAFLHTLRGLASWSGQRMDATDRLYLLANLPILLITGRPDPCIPHHHTLRAHQPLPGSRLELLDTGHFPPP